MNKNGVFYQANAEKKRELVLQETLGTTLSAKKNH